MNKVRETIPRPATPLPGPASFVPLPTTPRTVREMAETFAEVMTSTACPKDLIQPLSKLAKGAVAGARKAELMEARLDQTTAAKTARKSRKQESSRVLQTGGVLYARNARQMVMDRAHLD